MSDAVLLAIIAVVASLSTGTVVVAVGVWADGRRKRAEATAAAQSVTTAATVAAQAHDQNELVKVRDEQRARIDKLEQRLDAKDMQIAALTADLGRANVTIAQYAARIADLENDLAQLHRGQVERIETATKRIAERIERGEIGRGQQAMVAKEQADAIQATGDDTNERVRRQEGQQ